MKNNIRTFIAVEIEDRLRDELGRVQEKLRASGADVKWVETKNIHLTLKFLGDIPVENVEPIAAAVTKVTSTCPVFPIEIMDLGAFPDILFPKVIWAGVTKNAETLVTLARTLEEDMKKFKIKKEERPFAAHLTLGRTRSLRGKDHLVAALEETHMPPGLTQKVNHLTLFQSTLTPQGSIYTALKQIPLK